MRHGSCHKRYLHPPTAVTFSSVRAKESSCRKKQFTASPSRWPPPHIMPRSRGSRVVALCSTGGRWHQRPNLCVPRRRCFCVKQNFKSNRGIVIAAIRCCFVFCCVGLGFWLRVLCVVS